MKTNKEKQIDQNQQLNTHLYNGYLNLSLLKLDSISITKEYCIQNEITHINLASNNLHQLSDLFEFTTLKELNLSFNKLKQLPKLSESLTKLSLSHNEFVQLNQTNRSNTNSQLFDSLIELNISHNKISEFPPMKQLQKIDCSFNCFNSSQLFQTLSSLTSLNITGNQFTEFIIEDNSQLIELKCSMNSIKTIKLNISTLTFLDISFNPIESIDIHQCISLKTLYLNNTSPIKYFSSIETSFPIQIKELSLSSCELMQFPKQLTYFTDLTSLNLSSNGLLILSPQYTQLQQLKKLDVSLNLLQSFPVIHSNLEELNIGGNFYLQKSNKTVPFQLKTFSLLSPIEIDKNVHISSFVNAYNCEYIDEKNITAIVYCGKELPKIYHQCDSLQLISLETDDGNGLLECLSDVLNFIFSFVEKNEGVLLVCYRNFKISTICNCLFHDKI